MGVPVTPAAGSVPATVAAAGCGGSGEGGWADGGGLAWCPAADDGFAEEAVPGEAPGDGWLPGAAVSWQLSVSRTLTCWTLAAEPAEAATAVTATTTPTAARPAMPRADRRAMPPPAARSRLIRAAPAAGWAAAWQT